MSGTRQHHIPRFLQKGFNSQPHGQKPRAWVYRKGQTAFETALENIGVEKRFYQVTIAGLTISADDEMTQVESKKLSPLVARLRGARPGLVENEEAVTELISSIQLRTRAAWILTRLSAESMVRLIQDDIEIQRAVIDLVQLALKSAPGMLASLSAVCIPSLDLQEIARKMAELGKDISIPSLFAPGAEFAAMSAPKGLVEDVMEAIKVWGMTQLARYPESATDFRGCTFMVCDFTDARLVQGDTPVVYHRTDGGFTPVLHTGEVFDYAFLPLTSTRALVASKGGLPGSGETLQKASIRCSWSYFISDTNHERLQALTGAIGEAIPNFTTQDIKKIFMDSSMDAETHGVNAAAFLETPIFQAILKKWALRSWLRESAGQNNQGPGT